MVAHTLASTLRQDVDRILYSERVIQKRVQALGQAISRDYADGGLHVVSLLKGSVVFLADLLRTITVPCAVDFMAVSSYQGTSKGSLRVTLDLRRDPKGRRLLLVEDIVDTGQTLAHVKSLLAARRPQSIRTCALLDKPSRRQIPTTADYVGFHAPDEFLVGYGLDFKERYRNLPFIGILKKRVITGKKVDL